MRFLKHGAGISLLLLSLTCSLFAQTTTNRDALLILSDEYTQLFESQRGAEYEALINTATGPIARLNRSDNIELMGIDETGRLLYFGMNNLVAAQSLSTDEVWPGGQSGYDIDGTNTGFGELAEWDGGGVLTTHQEFNNFVVQMDNPADVHSHSTHVAGTMIGRGVNPSARGMSNGAWLTAYDWNNDTGEMAGAAAEGTKVSNHSYGAVAGWHYDAGDWYWFGDMGVDEEEDYQLGRYTSEARRYDEIMFNAPYYTICKSAGNDRGDGPNQQPIMHYVMQGQNWVESTQFHEREGGADGFDSVPHAGNAKNIITVGAVNDVDNGYNGPGSVSMSSFSCWGPTDDGRIKPDLVANGIQLISSVASDDDAYASYSGTSMASPNLAGSMNLVIQYYKQTHDGEAPLSATAKGLLIHTADECGPHDGPDYMFGWGLMNTWHACDVIAEDVDLFFPIQERILEDQQEDHYFYVSDGDEPITITICWTDRPGNQAPREINPDDYFALMNDLDVRLYHVEEEQMYFPYILNPDNPSAAATTGDNFRDNVEKIYLENPEPGTYRVDVTHKDELTFNLPQAYSIITTGVIWEDDPRVSPDNLSATLDDASGAVNLSWELEEENPGFIEFVIYRDGDEIERTTDLEYSDNLVDFGKYVYAVTSVWDAGESTPSDPVAVNWYEPVAPRFLNVTSYDTLSGALSFSWKHLRDRELKFDDGSAEDTRRFNLAGGIFAVRFSVEKEGQPTEVGAEFGGEVENYGEMTWLIYAAGDDSLHPGELLYEGDNFVPQNSGWEWKKVGDTVSEMVPGDEYWVGLRWNQANRTDVGWDTEGEQYMRGSFSPDGETWSGLQGPLRGNPMIRTKYGEVENFGDEIDELFDYQVYRNDELLANTQESLFDDVLPDMGEYRYTVHALYDQGEAISNPLIVNGGETSVSESLQPATFVIGKAYPNPFNPTVSVEVSLRVAGTLHAVVYDLLGREVAVLATGISKSGVHTISWDGAGYSAGMYFLSIQAGSVHNIQKLILMK